MLKWDLNKRFEIQVTVLTLSESKRTAGISVGDVGSLVTTPGGYFRNFWVGMCRWDPGTLDLYQS